VRSVLFQPIHDRLTLPRQPRKVNSNPGAADPGRDCTEAERLERGWEKHARGQEVLTPGVMVC
jgi:hypothetical protein